MSEVLVPDLLRHHKPIPFGDGALIHNIFCYIVKHYGNSGFSILVNRTKAGDVAAVIGDWNGNKYDIPKLQESKPEIFEFFEKNLSLILAIMKTIGLGQAQYFFAAGDTMQLVDIQISLNKFLGPGMLKDVFGRIFNIQETVSIEVVDDSIMKAIVNREGIYGQDLILKPNKFRMHHDITHNVYRPLYIETRR